MRQGSQSRSNRNRMLRKKRNNQRGQTLIEAVIALGAAVIVISAIAVSVLTSLNSAQFSTRQNSANHAAQEALETVRKIRDSGWGKFKTYSGAYCMGDDKTLTPKSADCGQNVEDIFVREVEIIHNDTGECGKEGSDISRVVVNVSWADQKCTSKENPFCHTVELSSCFADINSVINISPLLPSP